jgi:hypothetical protein
MLKLSLFLIKTKEKTMFSKTISTSLGPHQIIAIPTQNQFNIRVSRQVEGTFQITSRILIESPRIDLGPKMRVAEKEIFHLAQASEDELMEWSLEHDLTISKIDYISKKIFRTDPYTLFMSDVFPSDRQRLENKMETVEIFNEEEVEVYTQNQWWEALNDHVDYERLCYRALKTLKETSLLDLDQTAKILNYCGVKINDPTATLLTGEDCIQYLNALFESYASFYYEKSATNAWKKDLATFITLLPSEDKIVIQLPPNQIFSHHLIFSTTLNKLWLYLADTNAIIQRPSGGMSHRNRFGSALDRASATFLPGVIPPLTIHSLSCTRWSEATKHDMLHIALENVNLSREGWIVFATYILENTHTLLSDIQRNILYDYLLDRTISSSNFEEAFTLILQSFSGNPDLKKQLLDLSKIWYQKNKVFFEEAMTETARFPIMVSRTTKQLQ